MHRLEDGLCIGQGKRHGSIGVCEIGVNGLIVNLFGKLAKTDAVPVICVMVPLRLKCDGVDQLVESEGPDVKQSRFTLRPLDSICFRSPQQCIHGIEPDTPGIKPPADTRHIWEGGAYKMPRRVSGHIQLHDSSLISI